MQYLDFLMQHLLPEIVCILKCASQPCIRRNNAKLNKMSANTRAFAATVCRPLITVHERCCFVFFPHICWVCVVSTGNGFFFLIYCAAETSCMLYLLFYCIAQITACTVQPYLVSCCFVLALSYSCLLLSLIWDMRACSQGSEVSGDTEELSVR